MNTMQNEQLFTDLTPAQAAGVEGGRGDQLCSYRIDKDFWNGPLLIRNGPGEEANVVGIWHPNEEKLLEEPAVLNRGWRRFSSDGKARWVQNFIEKGVGGCVPNWDGW